MKRKAFLTFGVILVFAILAIPRSISAIETQAVIGEVASFIELSLPKLLEQLRSFVFHH